MTQYRVIIVGRDDGFYHSFDGEPQINLTFDHEGMVYRVVTRAHDEDGDVPTVHAKTV